MIRSCIYPAEIPVKQLPGNIWLSPGIQNGSFFGVMFSSHLRLSPPGFFMVLFILLAFILTTCGNAQHASLILTGSDDVVLTPLTLKELQFRSLIMNSSGVSNVELHGDNQEEAIVFAVDAIEGSIVDVWIDAPNHMKMLDYLPFGGEKIPSIPFRLKLAYANSGYSTLHFLVPEARKAAIEVPEGSSFVSFLLCNRPPETSGQVISDDHSENSVSRARAYIFLYGSIGPVTLGENVVAGNYQCNFSVNIEIHPQNAN